MRQFFHSVRGTPAALALLLLLAFLLPAHRATAALGDLKASFNFHAAFLALDPIRPRMYVSVPDSNEIAVIDTSTLTLIQLIPAGPFPVGLALSPDGSTLYVADAGSAATAVSVIDLATLTALPAIASPQPATDIAAGPYGQLYLTTTSPSTSLMQISTTGTAQAFISAAPSSQGLLQISPDRTTLYFGDTGAAAATLSSFDISTGTATLLQTGTFAGQGGQDLELSHSGAFIAFAYRGQGVQSIPVVPTSNLSLSNGSFSVGDFAENIAFSPDDSIAYSAPATQTQVLVFDTSTFANTGSFSIPGNALRLKTDSSGKYLFVTAGDVRSLDVYDTGLPAAVITSSTSQSVIFASPFSYTITATNSPTSFNATGLPPGLTVDPSTGIISGTVTSGGVYQAVISASNAIGVAMADLQLTVVAPLVIKVNGSGNLEINDQLVLISGTAYPPLGTTFSFTAVPDSGYIFKGWTGDITTGSNPLDFTIQGSTSLQANFAVAPPFLLSHTVTAPFNYGDSFSYQIEPSLGLGPFTYNATNLPNGLTVDPDTGIISGTLNDAGHFVVNISATNNGGTGAATYTFDVNARLTINAGSGGNTQPSGSRYLALSSTFSATATPLSGFFFAGWTGSITSSSNPLFFTIQQPTETLQANFVPVSTGQGPYFGLVSGTNPSDDSSGFLAISVNKLGKFSGAITIGGTRYLISGLFLGSSPATITIHRKRLPSLIVTLNLAVLGAFPQVTGTVTNGAWTSAISSDLSPLAPRLAPAARAGLYTVALTATSQTPLVPTGNGYASLSVAKTGAARIVGALPDGSPFSSSANIAPDGTLPIYTPLYLGQGYVIGSLTFLSATNIGILQGNLNWFKPTTTPRRPYPATFTTTLAAVGSSYSAKVKLTGTAGTLGFFGAGVTTLITQPFTLNSAHALVITRPSADSVTYRLNPVNGVFSGTFHDGKELQPYHGAILQQQNSGAGDFLNPTGSGSVTLTISP